MAGAYSFTLFPPTVILSFRHHQFLFIILVTVAYIQLKIGKWICHEKIQIKIEFGHGLMIFWQSNAPFTMKIV
jgi:hypothetical protein